MILKAFFEHFRVLYEVIHTNISSSTAISLRENAMLCITSAVEYIDFQFLSFLDNFAA